MTLRTVGVRLTAEIGEYQSKLKAAGQSTRDFKGELDKAAKSGNLDKVADRAAITGVALAGLAVGAVKMAADFDKAMSGVAAATHAPAAQIEALRAAAIQAGKDTQFSAKDAADGITELSKAGVSTADVLGGGLKGALALAAAGQISVGEAAETAASALTQFKLAGSQVPHVADLLAAGAGKAQGSVHDMGMALNQSGLVAAQFGLSIEDTTGTLAEFANAGLIGSDAGTSFKTMLLAMANPAGATQRLMSSLGISFYDAQGKFIGMAGVAEVLRQRLGDLSDEERQAALSQIFGNDAIRAASILYADGAQGVTKWKDAVNDSGYASETAAKLTDNLSGDIERLKGSLETLAIQSGGGANSGLRLLAKGLNDIVDQFNSLSPATSGAFVVLAGLSGALLLGGAAWVKYRKVVAETQEQLIATGPAGEKAAAGLGKVTSMLGKVGLWAAAAEAAGLLFSNLAKKSTDVDRLTESLDNLAKTGQSAGELNKDFGANFDKLGRVAGFAESADHGFGHFVNGVANSIPVFGDAAKSIGNFGSRLIAGTDWDTAKEQMTSLDAALTNYMNTTNDAQKSSDLWNRVLSQSGLDTQQLAELLPNAYKKVGELNAAAEQGKSAVGGMGNAAKGAKGKVGDLNSALERGADVQSSYKTRADSVAGVLRGETDALISLAKQLKAGIDPAFALINAQEGLASAQKDATKAVRAHGAGSKEAEAANRRLVLAALDLQDAAGRASGTLDGKLDPALRATLDAAGLTKGEIKNVEKQLKNAKKAADQYTGKYPAEVSLQGDKSVEAKLNKLRSQQLELAAGPTAAAAQTATQDYYNYRTKKATGGAIYGPGTGTSDSIPALLSDGEYVIKASSVKRVGLSNLDVINQEGRLPQAYAGGGAVWPFPVDASKTKIPDPAVLGGGAGPGGGATDDWIVKMVMARFPALHYISKFRQGARTLTGNVSYHARHRAVDWPPLYELALWWHNTYGARTKELITPWNELNIHNGKPHRYTGAVWNQHNFAGGNAHDHIAMANGGVIREPVVGVGASGRTYSLAERGPETVIPGYATGGLVNVLPRTSTAPSGPTGSRLDTATAALGARDAVDRLTQSLKDNGKAWSTATQKGRDNRSSLISGVKAAQDAAKAKYDETGSVKAANKVYDDYIRLLDQSLKKMHVNAQTRKALIKAYGERPKYDLPAAAARPPSDSSDLIKATQDHIGIEDSLQTLRGAFAWTRPTFDLHTDTGRSELGTLFGFLNAASSGAQSMFEYTGNAGQATAYYQGYLSQLRSTLIASGMPAKDADALIKRYGRITLTPKSNRWGGVYQHAASGALSEAMVAPGGPTRYAWAESSTGGELFAPKHGNLQKTRSEVGWAVANWWGGSVNWGGQGGAKHITIQAPIAIQLGAETITRQVQFEVDTQLGKVVDAIVYQTA